ncbi:MAG: DUF4364 family protein [Clostridiaceae bacterium]
MQDNRNNADNKILILYALANAKYAMTKHDLSIIMMDNLLMSYYNFQDSIYGLKDGRFIILDKDGQEEYVEITESGRTMLSLFSPNLDVQKRSMIDVYMEEMKNELIVKNTIHASFHPIDTDRFLVEIYAKEGRRMIFNLAIEVPNQADAEYICDNWKRNPEVIYYQFLNLLTANRTDSTGPLFRVDFSQSSSKSQAEPANHDVSFIESLKGSSKDEETSDFKSEPESIED